MKPIINDIKVNEQFTPPQVLGVGKIARIFGTSRNTVKRWAFEFRDYLGNAANPPKGETRTFTQDDVMVLALIADYWEDNPDYENIRAKLNSDDQFEDKYVRTAYLNTPLFQNIPDELDEIQEHIAIIGGIHRAKKDGSFKIAEGDYKDQSLAIAEAYKEAGHELVRYTLSDGIAHEMIYPILFMYRHAIEMYFKILLSMKKMKKRDHNFSDLMNEVRARYRMDFSAEWIRDRLDELNRIDPKSDQFRYADSQVSLPEVKLMIDVRQLRVVVDHICTAFKNEIFNSSIPPTYMP